MKSALMHVEVELFQAEAGRVYEGTMTEGARRVHYRLTFRRTLEEINDEVTEPPDDEAIRNLLDVTARCGSGEEVIDDKFKLFLAATLVEAAITFYTSSFGQDINSGILGLVMTGSPNHVPNLLARGGVAKAGMITGMRCEWDPLVDEFFTRYAG